MFRHEVLRTVRFACAVALAAIAFHSVASAEGFDRPLRKTVLDLGPSPEQRDFPNLHVHLSCYYYPTFMVKELTDDGNKGALRISVLLVDEARAPRCVRALSPGEKAFPDGGVYFWGVKRTFVFLIADDGEGEGRYFDVFDAGTLRRTLRDALRFNTYPTFSRTTEGGWSMRYQRVFFADCSLMKNGSECWRRVIQQTGLPDGPAPKCSGYDSYVEDPSLIAFPVEVALFPRPVRKVLAGPVVCFAAQ
jgi:hypothetical protein